MVDNCTPGVQDLVSNSVRDLITDSTQARQVFGAYCAASGHGDTNDETVPRLVAALHEMSVRQVACGINHTVALVDRLSPLSNDLRTLLGKAEFADVVFQVQGNS
jgi:hypothetical protein